MKFQTNTKPFVDALALGIVNANVSSFHKKSCIVQISAEEFALRINVESSRIRTEIRLKGAGSDFKKDKDGNDIKSEMIFVDSMLLKQLAATLETSLITLEFEEGGLTIRSGKSKFTLPKVLDSTEIELTPPSVLTDNALESELDKADWKFVKDFQMYAISMAFVHPVYTRVWVGEAGDVMVSNYDSGLFTHSKKSKLGNTCLLQDSIINLFNSLPEGTKVAKVGRNYIIHISSDSFEYVTEFTPEYEDDESIGSYNADTFLSMMGHDSPSSEVNVAAITKLLNQAILLSTTSEDTIKWIVKDNNLKLLDRNVDGNIEVTGDASIDYEIEFKLASLKQVISNYSDETVHIAPTFLDGEPTGILVWNDELTTLFAGVE